MPNQQQATPPQAAQQATPAQQVTHRTTATHHTNQSNLPLWILCVIVAIFLFFNSFDVVSKKQSTPVAPASAKISVADTIHVKLEVSGNEGKHHPDAPRPRRRPAPVDCDYRQDPPPPPPQQQVQPQVVQQYQPPQIVYLQAAPQQQSAPANEDIRALSDLTREGFNNVNKRIDGVENLVRTEHDSTRRVVRSEGKKTREHVTDVFKSVALSPDLFKPAAPAPTEKAPRSSDWSKGAKQ